MKSWMYPVLAILTVLTMSSVEIFLSPMFPAVGLAGGLCYLIGVFSEKARHTEQAQERAEVADFWNNAAVSGAPVKEDQV